VPGRADGAPYAPADRGAVNPATLAQPPAPGGPAGGAPGGAPPAFARPPSAAAPGQGQGQGQAPGVTQAPGEVKGRIHIADEVVEKVAGLATMEVEGVADLGGDFARALESVRERIGIGAKRGDQGVKAEVKGHEVAINVTIMVEFGYVVLEVARQVQLNVAAKTSRMLGLRVVEVNVNVDDVRTARAERESDGDVVTGGPAPDGTPEVYAPA